MEFLARPKIFAKLLIVFILAAMLPLMLTWYVANSLTERNARALAEADLRREGGQIAMRTDAWLKLNNQSLLEHASTPAIRSMKPELQKPVLLSIAQAQPWTTVAFTTGADGISLSRSDNLAPINYADREYFKQAMAGRTMGQQVLMSRTSGRPACTFSVPIRDDAGRIVGILAKANGLSEITDQLVNTRIGRTGRAMLIAPDGKLLALTGLVADKELKDFSQHPAFTATSARDGIIRYEDEGRKVLASIHRTRFDWLVAVQMDETEALEPVRDNDRAMFALLSVALLIAALFALMVAPGIARPIRRLTASAEEISRGKFDHEITETDRSDEIGHLARAIERLTISLRIAMTRLASVKRQGF